MSTAGLSVDPSPAVPGSRIEMPITAVPAPEPSSYSLKDLKFIELSPFEARVFWVERVLFRTVGALILLPPVALTGGKEHRRAELTVLGQALGFSNEPFQRLLSHHERRMALRDRVIIKPLVLSMIVTVVLFTGLFWWATRFDGGWTFAVFIALFLVFFATSAVLPALTFRLSGRIVDCHFADSLCTVASLYLLVELYREDVLLRSDYRRALMDRFDTLARATQLLTLRYPSSDPEIRTRLQRHFREMVAYIRARQAWALTPMSTTLHDLHRDMHTLVSVFITGSYGELSWRPEAERQPEPRSTRWRSLLAGSGRLIGLAAPLAGMVYLLRNPDLMKPLGLENHVVALVFVAWVLLALDAVLKLGVVSGLMGLAKSIKELK